MNELDVYLNTEKINSGKTKNIADFENIILDGLSNIREEIIKEGTPDEFTQTVADYEGQKVKLPIPVLIDIKKIKEEFDLTEVKVMKTGSGRDTKYTVVPVGVKPKIVGEESN